MVAGEMMKLVGLAGFEESYPHELSGGMQQRANMARALVTEPKILLMDEPLASLDAQTRESMQEELLTIWQKTGTTTIFVTHQIDEAIYLGDRVIVLSSRPGKIIDIIGDMALLGCPVLGHIVAYKSGHSLHLKLMATIAATPEAWEFVELQKDGQLSLLNMVVSRTKAVGNQLLPIQAPVSLQRPISVL